MAKFVSPEDAKRFFDGLATVTDSSPPSPPALSKEELAHRQRAQEAIEDALAELEKKLCEGEIAPADCVVHLSELTALHPNNQAILAEVRAQLAGQQDK